MNQWMTVVRALLCGLIGLGGSPSQAAPAWDWQDIPASLHRLIKADDADARRIRAAIAHGPVDLAEEKRIARSWGMPLAVNEWPRPVPADKDAAPLYEQYGELMDTHPWTDEEVRVLNTAEDAESLTPHQARALRAALDRQREAMNVLHRAAARPRYSPMPRAEPVSSQPFPNYTRLREAARMLRLEARVLMLEGKTSEAVRIQALGYGVARHAAAEPTVIAYLVAEACAGIADAGFADLLRMSSPNEGISVAVRAAVQNAPSLSLAWAFRGESLYAASAARLARQQGPRVYAEIFSDEYDEADQPWVPPVRQLTRKERAMYMDLVAAVEADNLRRLRGAMAAARKPFPANRAELERVCSPLDDPANPIADPSRRGFATFPDLANFGARAQTMRAVTSAGTAVLAHRARTGAWPETLAAAVSPAPTDPFSGKPVLYRRESDGFVVYSVGEDGAFTGGKPGEHHPLERFFRYPATPAPN